MELYFCEQYIMTEYPWNHNHKAHITGEVCLDRERWTQTYTNNQLEEDRNHLTHLPLEKNGTILVDNIFKCIFLNENDIIAIQISLKLVPRRPINNKSALVQVMVWRQTGDKQFPEPMLTQFIDAYMRHYG